MSTRKHKGEIYYSIVHAFQLDESRNLNGLPVVLLSTLGACRENMKPVGPSRLSALFILKTLYPVKVCLLPFLHVTMS